MPQLVRQKPSCGDRVWARGAGLVLVAASLLSACQCGAVGALPCTSAADCPADQLCRDAHCRRACNSRGDCGSGELCVDGACVPATVPTDAARADSAAADMLLRDQASVERAAADGAVPDSVLADLTAADTSAPDASALDGSGGEAGLLDAPALDGPPPDALGADQPGADRGATDVRLEDSGPADQGLDGSAPLDASGTPDNVTATDTGAAPDTSTAPDSASAPDLATPPDTAAVDSGPSAAQLACLARYGTATDFLYCGGGDGWCEFYAATGGTSCQDLCTARGGTCLGVQDNQGGVGTATCEPLATAVVCTTVMNDALCRCTTEVADAGSSDAAAASCSALYGATPGFLLCREDATSCEFYHLSATTDLACSEVCARFGGACTDAHDNPDPVGNRTCEYKPVVRTCDEPHADAICTCTR